MAANICRFRFLRHGPWAFLALLATAHAAHAREPVVGLPCDGCEAIFEGMPESIPARARIAPPEEPGQPMTVAGRVLGADGKPRAGIVVYAHHTDARGIYPAPANRTGRASERHGALRGWSRSDADGRYTFDSMRPASYPGRNIPAHVHLQVLEPGCATYYIDDVVFTDDPLLTPEERRRRPDRGGSGIATPTFEQERWQVSRDIQLGANVPGYPECGAGRAAS